MHESADAIVIGAGPAGSAMAYSLARRGWDVVLMDKSTYPRHKACGEFLSPEARQTLGALGLEDAVRTLLPAEITDVRIHTERGHSLALPLPGPAWGVSRFALDARLHESAAASGVRICAPFVVARVDTASSGFVVEGRRRTKLSGTSHERWQTRVAINAYGRHPPHVIRMARTGMGASAAVGIKSHFICQDAAPIVDLYFFQHGYVGISPIENGRLNVAALLFDFEFERHDVARSLARILADAAERIPALARRFVDMRPVPGTQASTFPVMTRLAPRAWNGLPCIGDAAAVVPPFLGSGMALALRTAEWCAPMADACLAGTYTLDEWKHQHSRKLAKQYGGMRKWSGWMERALMDAMRSAWMMRLGAKAPRIAERLVQALLAGK